MTEHDIRITAVHPSAFPLTWIVRGESVRGGERFKGDTENRVIVASCIGAKVIGWPVRVTCDDSGDIIAVSVL